MGVRTRVSSGSPWEPRIGFSRAVRSGAHVFVSGTAPIGADGKTVGEGDVRAQTRRCFEVALAALGELGGRVQDVVRTRVLLADVTRWEEAAEVHGAYFRDVRPACTFVQVARFIDPSWLVEIELDALIEH